ncbi:MAG: DUF4340 domain-containing protein [Dehalococcoidales bacterium]|nr:DUF4340 domain-containing protein [Dehalococcoidales bacterium]
MKLKSILVLLSILAIAGVVFLLMKPKTEQEPTAYQPLIWDFNMDALKNIEIILPRMADTQGAPNHQSWVLHDDRYFYFDVPGGTKVDMERWGGGVPLILSGPSAARVIFKNLPDSELAQYGFTQPSMVINLALNDTAEYHIQVGNSTPSGSDYYIKLVDKTDVYTVDKSWFEVVSGLVTNPPYQKAKIAVQSIAFMPATPTVNQPVTILAKVANTGILANTKPVDIILKVQGDTIETQQVTLAGGASETLSFSIPGKAAGTYSININGTLAKLVIQ